jgi:hypothetical protein
VQFLPESKPALAEIVTREDPELDERLLEMGRAARRLQAAS